MAERAAPRLGAHMSIAGGLPRAVDRAYATRCESLQIFTKSAGQWRARSLSCDEVEAFRMRARELDVRPIVAHASYLINVAAPDRTLRRRSMAALVEEMNRADALGLLGLVLHPGSYTTGTEERGLRLVGDAVNELLNDRHDGRAMLLLEHTAGQGTNLGHKFEHLATIIDAVDQTHRVGVCLDTCHLLAAGYDIASAGGYAQTFEQFDATVGLARLQVLHLNDSKYPCGSRRDRHDHIGRGWVGLKAFRRLLEDPRLAGLPMILETPKSHRGPVGADEPDPADVQNLQTLRSLRDT